MLNILIDTISSYSRLILPWILIGIFLAHLAEYKLNFKNVSRYLKSSSLGELFTIQVLGMVSPLSILSFLPILSELESNGFNTGLLLSFLMAERAYDLQSFFVISGFFGPQMAVKSFLIICLSLMLTAIWLHKRKIIFRAPPDPHHNHFWFRQSKILFMVMIGVLIAALLRVFIPADLLTGFAGGDFSGMAVSLLLGLFFYFGPVLANYPVAKTFADLGMSGLGIMTFLTVSPILNIVILTMFGAAVGFKDALKAVFIYSITAVSLAVIITAWF